MRCDQHDRAARFVAGLAVLGLCLTATPAARADTKSDLAQALVEIAGLQQSAETASQQARAAQEQYEQVSARLTVLTAQVQHQVQVVEASRKAMGRAARTSYSSNGMDAVLYLLLADGPQEFARSASDLRRVTDATTSVLKSSRQREAELAQSRQEVAQQREVAQRLNDQAAQSSALADEQLAAAQTKQAALEQKYAAELAEQRRLEQEEADRQALAARAALAAQAARQQPTTQQPATRQPTSRQPTSKPATAQPDRARPTASQPPTPIGAGERDKVVAYALAQVGDRYVLGAHGPDAFDCSGLVAAAYAAAGVRLPSYSVAQAGLVQRIPLSAAQPGDLLFYFGSGASHVSIYLGGGRMVHAANPSKGVLVGSINESWYRERFTMAGRVG